MSDFDGNECNGGYGPGRSQLGEQGPGLGSKTAELEGLSNITKHRKALGEEHGVGVKANPAGFVISLGPLLLPDTG